MAFKRSWVRPPSAPPSKALKSKQLAPSLGAAFGVLGGRVSYKSADAERIGLWCSSFSHRSGFVSGSLAAFMSRVRVALLGQFRADEAQEASSGSPTEFLTSGTQRQGILFKTARSSPLAARTSPRMRLRCCSWSSTDIEPCRRWKKEWISDSARSLAASRN